MTRTPTFSSVGRKIKIDLADMDYLTWLRDLQSDAERCSCCFHGGRHHPRMTVNSGSCLT